MNEARVGVVLGVVAALVISVTNVASRLHFETGSTPTTFLLWRYALFAGALGFGLAALGRLDRVAASGRRRDLIGVGLLNVGGASALAFAIERLPVALAIVVLYLFPLLTLLLDAAVSGRRPRARVAAALGVALVGLALALGLGGESVGRLDPVGLACALGAAIGFAGSIVWAEHRLGALDDATRLFGVSAVGLVFALALAVVGGDIVSPFTSFERGATLLVATLGFAITMAALFAAIARIGAGTTALLMNLEPPATVLLAALVLGERLGATQLLGVALVVAAVVAAQRAGKSRVRATATATRARRG